MKPLLRFSVSVWTLRVFSALLLISQSQCISQCNSTQTENLTTATTSVTYRNDPNCNLSIGNNISGNGSITGLIPGTVYQIFINCSNCSIITTTRPAVVRNLTIINVTTSSVSLDWTEPVGHVTSYTVQWVGAGVTLNNTTNESSFTVNNLIPGFQYNFTVSAVAVNSLNTGDSTLISTFTSPEKPGNITITARGTNNLSISWTLPRGRVDNYVVNISDGGLISSYSNIKAGTSASFTGLNPGRIFTITVTSVAGNFSTTSDQSSFATFPTPPGSIIVSQRTNSSLYINWATPALMEGAPNISYHITYQKDGVSQHANTTANQIELSLLSSGTSYNITVETVGPQNLRSTVVPYSAFTLPNPVLNLVARPKSTTSIEVSWSYPYDFKLYYTYLVQTYNSVGALINYTTDSSNITIPNLEPGTRYNFSVTTIAATGSGSTVEQTFNYTMPNPVLNLVARPKSTTSIEVSWSYPYDFRLYYTYLVQTYNSVGALINYTTVSSNITDVPNLEPGTRYNFSVTTIAATESESTVEQTFSYTMPKAVTNLTVQFVNTTSIQLTWLKQSDYKPTYSYLVFALQDTVQVQNNSTLNETYTFFNLTPGAKYTFNVFTVVEGVTSAVDNTSSYTKPAAVSGIVAIGSTSNMSVSWTKAFGQVDSYTVLLYKDQLLNRSNTNLNSTIVNTLFQDLKPGVLYCVEVVTNSGPYTNSSRVYNATFPNPPGPIMVASQNVESINFTWPFPANMDYNLYNFTVSSFRGCFSTSKNWFLLDNLQSGSPYNISVVTVGVWNYKSTEVKAENYTRPYNVTMLTQAGITTNAVTLMWEQLESKASYSYVVQVSNSSFNSSIKVNTSITITGLLSGSNYSFTVTTQTEDGTQAAPVTVWYFTRPYSTSWSKVETLNTTAIHLVWMKPLDYKNGYRYRVTTGCGSQNIIVTGEDTQISELTPGTNCTFCVYVRVADGTEGQANCTSQYTQPGTVQPSISSQGSNSSILVSWTKPPGKVEYYKLYLNGTSTALVLNSTSTSWLFGNLSAGMLYSVVVTTFSGPFNASSPSITNATFPNAPGPVEVLTKTTSSITIRWSEAPLMTGASFFYLLTYTNQQGKKNISTTTNYTFASLPSGTSYIISVATVGVMGFESGKVQIPMVTTRPFSVRSLNAITEEENIIVTWKEPDEYKESYRYNLTWQSSNGSINSNITNITEYNIKDLVPGSPYIINVTTETSDGTQSATNSTSCCTDASPVNNIQCTGPNTTNATLILSWNNPKGKYSGFWVTVKKDGKIINTSSSSCCNQNVSNLLHHTNYNLTVETQSCGSSSIPVSYLCSTGITVPPIPDNFESLVMVDEKLYNKFSLKITSSLLNNTSGPITHVGVLMTSNLSDDTSDVTKYLGNTYNQWKAGNTLGYLATVKENIFQTRSEGNPLSIQVGDESWWEGYKNGPLDGSGKYKYAVALFTSLTVQNQLVNGSLSLVSITNFYPIIELPMNPAIGIAIGATLGFVCFLIIVLIGFMIYWKRFSTKKTSDIQIQSMRAKVSVAVRVEDYEAYYKKQKADSNCGFAEEFEDLKPVGTVQSKASAMTVENKPKNRYNNVLPYDSSRVKLSIIHGSPYDDYINANYMPGYNSKKEFIAAQGPLPTTVNEFWRMIWEKNVHTVVMLTRCNEQGRVKCEQYWASRTKHFDNITVTTLSEIQLDDWTIRDFSVKNVKTAETRSVRHFHFTAWPDHGVPETTELLISFRHLVREHMDQYSRHSPTVVHCSAGVGRTGTFIAIDRLIFQIERENIVDVYGIVHDLRMHRPLMVQTEDQYVFLNQCSMDIIRSRTGTNVDLIYQNTAALSIYENVAPKKGFPKNGYHNA